MSHSALVSVKVLPGAAMDRIDGLIEDADGKPLIKLRVTAPPDKGRANKAVIALIARTLGLPKSAVYIIAGDKSKLKTVRIEAEDPVDPLSRLAAAGEG